MLLRDKLRFKFIYSRKFWRHHARMKCMNGYRADVGMLLTWAALCIDVPTLGAWGRSLSPEPGSFDNPILYTSRCDLKALSVSLPFQ